MSLFRFLRNELIDLIEWNQASNSEVMAWRFPRNDNEIKNGARLVVREGQQAIFVDQGQLADVFVPGLHTLSTANIPILSKLRGWKHGFQSPFKADAYFVTTRRFMDLKWGTANPVTMRDAEFGMVRIRAYGSYAIQVTDPAAFLRQLLATSPTFEVFEIAGQLRNMIVTRFSNVVAQSGIPVLDLAANLNALGEAAQQAISAEFAEMGLSVPIFLVENISLPPKVEKALDKRTSMGIIGNLDQYMKFQAAESMEKAAENPSQGAAGIGVGLGAGMAMSQQFVQAMGQPGAAPPAAMPGAGGGAAVAPPPLPAAVAWFAGIGGQSVGPLDGSALQQRASAGELTHETLVWKQGMGNWTPAGQVAELAPLFGPAPPPFPSN